MEHPLEALAPVAEPTAEPANPDAPATGPDPGIALCLSGGGYRAMLFHVGALWRLNEAGLLPKLNRISSVSGGSITAGALGAGWSQLAFDQQGVGRAFRPALVEPIRRLAGHTIDVGAISWGVFSPVNIVRGLLGIGTVGEQVSAAYRKHLFGERTLQDLPADAAGPRFVINATSLQTGRLWRFSRPFAAEYSVGLIHNPTIRLADAVAASSAFPPFLSPVVLNLRATDFEAGSGTTLQRPPYTTRVVLTDGGVYDNLGLETAWKRYQTVLVSDGGGQMGAEERPNQDWLRQVPRVLNVVDNQVRSLRKRQLLASYQAPPGNLNHRTGTYWGIRTNIAHYGLPDALDCPLQATMRLANVETRLAAVSDDIQERLINWGYAVCDAGLRRWVDTTLPRPGGFPYARGV